MMKVSKQLKDIMEMFDYEGSPFRRVKNDPYVELTPEFINQCEEAYADMIGPKFRNERALLRKVLKSAPPISNVA